MRDKLKPLLGQRRRFTATFSYIGRRKGKRYGDGKKAYILLHDICLVGEEGEEEVADYVWVMPPKYSKFTTPFGQRVIFTARVTEYAKLVDGEVEIDYGLKVFSRFRTLERDR